MNITIIAVGKLKERFWSDACAEYLKRLKPYAVVRLVEVPDVDPGRAGSVAAGKSREGTSILRSVPEGSYCLLLAIEGREWSSESFSRHLDNLCIEGKSRLTFVIGGSEGVDASVYERADELLSFGRITLPHNLARVVLLEQLYRAVKISRREPYHK